VRRRLDAARELARDLPGSHDQAYLLLNLGRGYERLAASEGAGRKADLQRAHEAFVEAGRIAGQIGDRLAESYALGYQGALYEKRGRLDESLDLTRRARFLAQEAGAPEALYRWDWQLGRIFRAKGDPAAAIEAYRRAVDSLEKIRFEMAHGYATGGSSFREAVGPVYFELVDLLLANAPDPADTAAHQTRLLEARETVEGLKAAELRDYFQDECVDQLQSKIEKLDQVSGSALVVYPILLPDRLELLLSRPAEMRRVTVDVSGPTLDAEARTLRRLLEKRTTLEYLPHAQRLYDWLVRPYEDELAGGSIETLVFVPDGALRMIPLAALHDGKAYLVDRFALATTPGLSLTDPRPLDRENLKVFLSGLSESVQGFPPLAYVPAELSSVRSLYGGTLLLDRDFQLARVEGTLGERDFNVVHIASHGEFSSDSGSSYLLAWDGRLTMDRLSEYVGLFRFRETPIELLTLSACETAEGDERAALGLAGVAIKAGARSALGTLWSVNDAATEKLIVEFYRQLKEDSTSKATALQRAQLALRRSPAYEHPFYWSPFLLISNWL
jgi:CHAT domain-containing protein